MKQAKISELKNHLSRYLAYVRKGGRVRVFDRDRPIADLVPLTGAGGADPSAAIDLARLERLGIVRRGEGELSEEFLSRSLPRARASVVDALLEERRSGR